MLVEEEQTPEGAAPIQWVLITALAADSPEACCRIVEYSARRGRIEDWHRVLKSGCKVEELENRTEERIARASAINLVIAWRIMLMTLPGRKHPDLPPDVFFSEPEIDVLKAFAAQQGFEAPDTLAKAIRAVARIGGYLYRPRGPRPAPRSSGGAMQPSRECASDTLWQWKADHDKNQQNGKPGIICGARVALGLPSTHK